MGKKGGKGKGGKGGGGAAEEAEVVQLEIPEGTPAAAISVAVQSAKLPLVEGTGFDAFLGEAFDAAAGGPLRCWARCQLKRAGAPDTRFWPPALEIAGGDAHPSWTRVASGVASQREGGNSFSFAYPAAPAADGDAAEAEGGAGGDEGKDGGAAKEADPAGTLSRPVPLAALPVVGEDGEAAAPASGASDDQYLLELLASSVSVELFVSSSPEGEDRDPGADKLVAAGTVPVSLAALQRPEGATVAVEMDWKVVDPETDPEAPPPPATKASVVVRVAPDAAMEEKCRGGRVLTINLGSVEAAAVPDGWQHPFTWDQLQDAERGEGWKENVYDVTLALPTPVKVAGGTVVEPTEPPPPAEGDDGAAAGGDEGKEGKDGDAGAAAAAAEEDGAGAGEEAAASPPPEPKEIVAWPAESWDRADTKSRVLFLDREAVRAVRAAIAAGGGGGGGGGGDGGGEGEVGGGAQCRVTLARYPKGYPPPPPTEEEAAAAAAAAEAGEEAPPSHPAAQLFSGSIGLASLLQPEATAASVDTLALAPAAAGAAPSNDGGGDDDDEYGAGPDAADREAAAVAAAEGLAGLALRGVSISLDQCLVKQPPPPPQPTLTTSDLIPARAPVERKPYGKDAAAQLRDDVKEITRAVADEINGLFGGGSGGSGGSGGEAAALTRAERRRVLLHRLNTSGAYYGFREKLKRSVVRVVREQFAKDASLATGGGAGAAADAMISSLYARLMEEVQRSLLASFDAAGDARHPLRPDNPEILDRDGAAAGAAGAAGGGSTPAAVQACRDELGRLRVLALEAERCEDWPTALRRHQDRVHALEKGLAEHGTAGEVDLALEEEAKGPLGSAMTMAGSSTGGGGEQKSSHAASAASAAARLSLVPAAHGGAAGPWYDYGKLLLERNGTGLDGLGRALECLKEAIGIDQAHAPSLTLYAAILCVKNELPEACVLADAAVRSAEQAAPAAAPAALADARAVATLLLHLLDDDHPAAPSSVPKPPSADACLAAGHYAAARGLAELGAAAAEAALACAAADKEDAEDLPIGAIDYKAAGAAQDLLTRAQRVQRGLLLARLASPPFTAGRFAEAEGLLEEALDMDPDCAQGWCLLGHLRSEPGASNPVYDAKGARAAYQMALRANAAANGDDAEPKDPRLALRYDHTHTYPSSGLRVLLITVLTVRFCSWAPRPR